MSNEINEINESMSSDELKEWARNADEDYRLVLDADGQDHELEYVNNVIRWKSDPMVRMLHDELKLVNLNDLIIGLCERYGDQYKNDHRLRKYYRGLGYSLSGYWEIFFWEANNDEAGSWINETVDEIARGDV